MNVSKGLPHLCRSLATLDVHKLIICQVEADDGHDLLDANLVLFTDLGIHFGRCSFLGLIYDVLKVHESQNHLHFELTKAKFLLVELVHDSSSFDLEVGHIMLKE